ncbi:alpha/beta hydrolase [Streptomyces sp. SID13031]|uniref:alpha/beta fold hydrolase n=1 Tax=Streptomyces sp. SID13031 TaxID=2706046 RepID=UPI0013C7F339|nr:alpha/beta hydrolase [Streptomyces sp. SID13031]
MIEERIQVSPEVELFVAHSPGPADNTLLVIHGGPCWDHTYLREPLIQLAPAHRLVFPDLRGCGRSTGGLPADRYTPDLVIDDLVGLLDHLEVEQADVLGFSYGGLIAQRLALRTNRVRRLIVASSSIPPVAPDAFGNWPERTARQAEETPTDLEGPERNRHNAITGARANVWRADSLPDYLTRINKIHFTNDWDAPYLAGILPSPRYPDALERFTTSAVPILLLHGRQDMTFPAHLATEAATLIPTAEAVVLDEAGHMTHIDQPTAWLNAVRDFLR